MRALRVLFGPVNMADQGPATAEAMRALGAHAATYESAVHPFFPNADFQETGSGRFPALGSARRFFRLAAEYDVVHLQSVGFLPPLTTRIPPALESTYFSASARLIRRLRRQGKIVAITFHGSDVRPLAEIAAHWDRADDVLALPSHEPGLRARRIRYSRAIAAACDLVFVTTPDLIPHVERAELTPVIPSRAFTAAVEGASPPLTKRDRSLLRVLHAPSSPATKGTAHIEQAVHAARAQGIPVDLRVVTGAPTSEVVQAMLASDVAVDQVNFGWYSAVAVESMALGRPAIARIDPHYATLFETATKGEFRGLEPIHSDARSLVATLKMVYESDDGAWAEMTARARATFERVHRPEVVAKQILDRYASVGQF